MAKRQCKSTTRAGNPCGSPPLTPGKTFGDVAVSGAYCMTHDPDLPDEYRIGGATEGGGRRRKPRHDEVLHKLVTENIIAAVRPHWLTLGFDVVVDDDAQPRLVKAAGGGAKVSATHQGEVIVSDVDDLGAMIAASEKLMDRVLGRPKQATEISGPEGGPVQVVDVRGLTDDALRELAAAVGVADDDASSRPG